MGCYLRPLTLVCVVVSAVCGRPVMMSLPLWCGSAPCCAVLPALAENETVNQELPVWEDFYRRVGRSVVVSSPPVSARHRLGWRVHRGGLNSDLSLLLWCRLLSSVVIFSVVFVFLLMDDWYHEVDNWCEGWAHTVLKLQDESDECVRTSGQMIQLLPSHWVILFLIPDLVQGPYLRRHQMRRKRWFF